MRYHNPSYALRGVLRARGVEPLSNIWHRAAFYEQPGNNYSPDECVDRAVRYVIREPDHRFGWIGDMSSGTLTCVIPGCGEAVYVSNPSSANLDHAATEHWDRAHRAEFGA